MFLLANFHSNLCNFSNAFTSLQSLCAGLASRIGWPDVLAYLLNHSQKLGVLAALSRTIGAAAVAAPWQAWARE